MQKVVVITGCSSGFGYLSAIELAEKGWLTYATVHHAQHGGSGDLMTLSKKYPHLRIIELDVTKQEDVEHAVAHIIREAGKIDVLVNNAGFGFVGPVETFSIEEIKEQYDVNIFGYLRMIKAVAPHMRNQKNGKIINISSINGLISFPLYGVYSSSKFAIETLSEALDFELRPFGIKVFLVEPGGFVTNFTVNSKLPAAAKESVYRELIKFREKYDASKDRVPENLKWLIGPQRVASKIFSIASNENHRSFRNVIGVDARLFMVLNKLLPRFIKQYLLRKVYNW